MARERDYEDSDARRPRRSSGSGETANLLQLAKIGINSINHGDPLTKLAGVFVLICIASFVTVFSAGFTNQGSYCESSKNWISVEGFSANTGCLSNKLLTWFGSLAPATTNVEGGTSETAE